MAEPKGVAATEKNPRTLPVRGRQGAEPDLAAGRRPLPNWLLGLVARHPHLKQLPHPALAHFPITFLLSASFFSVLFLLTGIGSLETAAFHCLGGGVLTTPAAMATGVVSQRLNHPRPPPTFALEKRLSYLLGAVAAGAFIWRLCDPRVLQDLGGINLLYLLLVLAVTPLVTIIGYFGGMVTFPLNQD